MDIDNIEQLEIPVIELSDEDLDQVGGGIDGTHNL